MNDILSLFLNFLTSSISNNFEFKSINYLDVSKHRILALWDILSPRHGYSSQYQNSKETWNNFINIQRHCH